MNKTFSIFFQFRLKTKGGQYEFVYTVVDILPYLPLAVVLPGFSQLAKCRERIICVPRTECDKIGRFLKVLVNKFAYKSIPKRLATFGLFRNRSIYVKTDFGYDLGYF